MAIAFPKAYLARHGETAWSLTGQHTGLTDLALTERGEQQARRFAERLKAHPFAAVFASPLQRVRRTCELAGFEEGVHLDYDLHEWDYGAYEGLTPEEIDRQRPGWELFRDGCPDGESVGQVAARADRVLSRLRSSAGDVLVFSSGHILRVLAARWLGLDPAAGRYLMLGTGALSVLGYHHGLADPVIDLWNECPEDVPAAPPLSSRGV